MKSSQKINSKIVTIYGRNPVIEALQDESLKLFRLHLATSNKPSPQIDKILKLAKKRGVEVRYHDKLSLSRISKNSKQDQGVALDIESINFISLEEFIKSLKEYKIIALDGLTNPQNIGMIIRSSAAGDIDAILMPWKKKSSISPLIIKASAGTLFKIPIIKTTSLVESLITLKKDKATIYGLDSNGKKSLLDIENTPKSVYLLGSESQGLSKQTQDICDEFLFIPMNRGVESLNVAVTASLIALCPKCRK